MRWTSTNPSLPTRIDRSRIANSSRSSFKFRKFPGEIQARRHLGRRDAGEITLDSGGITTRSQITQNQGCGNPGALNARFAMEDLRIALDVVAPIHKARLYRALEEDQFSLQREIPAQDHLRSAFARNDRFFRHPPNLWPAHVVPRARLLVIPAERLSGDQARWSANQEARGVAVGTCLDFPMVLRREDRNPAAALQGVDSLFLPEDPEILRTGHKTVAPGQGLANAAAQFAPGNHGHFGQIRRHCRPRVTVRCDGAHKSS